MNKKKMWAAVIKHNRRHFRGHYKRQQRLYIHLTIIVKYLFFFVHSLICSTVVQCALPTPVQPYRCLTAAVRMLLLLAIEKVWIIYIFFYFVLVFFLGLKYVMVHTKEHAVTLLWWCWRARSYLHLISMVIKFHDHSYPLVPLFFVVLLLVLLTM